MSKVAADITAQVKQCALEAGFDLVRVTGAEEFSRDRQAALDRLEKGLMDGLPWYTESRVLRGSDPQQLLPGARSIISLGLSYFTGAREEGQARQQPLQGRVARYALGQDYHRAIKYRMKALAQTLAEAIDPSIEARWYVDDGPMLDRAAASRAGLGWFGKNTNILTSSHGSWVFLGQVITSLELTPDRPLLKSCGECTLCIEACPTGAIVEPYVIDNPRCISHLTIENREPIPIDLRPRMQDWVFGCDICQDVCPVNRKGAPARYPVPPLPALLSPSGAGDIGARDIIEATPPGLVDLAALLRMTREDFQAAFRSNPVKRARWAGLLRNACVALGNGGSAQAAPVLMEALDHPEELVRGHAAWALGQLGGPDCQRGLEKALDTEQDPWVRQEIGSSLQAIALKEDAAARLDPPRIEVD